ncbi:MAG: inorganic phosphate transporter [Clostridia bacterium]|nr:inorganic phosphate transporter [Clostridia bacterium]
MSYAIVLLILISLYTFYMGYTDGSNAVATTVATRAMKPRLAIILAACVQFLTVLALYFFSSDLSVAETVGTGLVDPASYAEITAKGAFVFLFSALLSSIIWSLITYFLKQPNSTSHTLLGGIIGAGIAAFGFSSIHWMNVFLRIILMILLAPLISVGIAYLINKLLRKAALHAPMGTGKAVTILQWINTCLIASAIAVNDVQKSIGVYLMIVSLGIAGLPATPPLYIVLSFGALLGFGILFGGYHVIVTIGQKLFKITPLMSLSSQISTNIIMFSSSALGIPISTGQVISSGIVGIGISERARGVKWITVKKIALGWVVTMPATVLFGAILYLLLHLIIGG